MKNLESLAAVHTHTHTHTHTSILKNETSGVSLIALIITIIVIIILAAIVMMASGETVDEANFAKFVSEFGDYHSAVQVDFMNRKADLAVKGTIVSDEQVYYGVAKNQAVEPTARPTADGKVANLGKEILPEDIEGTVYYEITAQDNVNGWNRSKSFYSKSEKLYVTDRGEVFTLPGFPRMQGEQQRYYVNETKYYVGEAQMGPSGSTEGDTGEEETSSMKIGDYVDYHGEGDDGAHWIVWEVKGDNLVITPTDPLGELDLGSEYDNDKAKAVNDWYHAEEMIEKECKKYINPDLGITENNIRSMTIEDVEACMIDKDAFIQAMDPLGVPYGDTYEYSSENIRGDSSFLAQKASSGTFDGHNKEVEETNGGIKISRTGENSANTVELVQTYYHGVTKTEWKEVGENNSGIKDYGEIIGRNAYKWLASKLVRLHTDSVEFLVWRVSYYDIDGDVLCYSNDDNVTDGDTRGVAPMITLSASLLTGEGQGTKDNPWKLEKK